MDNKITKLIKTLYKDEEGNPLELTPGQVEIFETIAQKLHPRNHLMCYTRYGKSLTVALAVLTRASSYPEKWAIVANTKDKAKIIMSYINGHIFDNEYTKARFVRDKGERDEDVKKYRNKSHITFDLGEGRIGEIFIASAKEALGFGASNVVEDESALIENEDHALVMRMLGDKPDNFLVKIGNPFNRNHFLDSFKDPTYHKIVIDVNQGVREGRVKQEYVDEMKQHAFFDILYLNIFPPEGSVDDEGWIPLFTESEIKQSMQDGVHFGEERAGVDVADSGLNNSAIIKRSSGYAEILFASPKIDPMDFVGQVILSRDQINVKKYFVDRVGVGAGVLSRLNELSFQETDKTKKLNIFGVNAGEKPIDQSRFDNRRAEMYWHLREWIKAGGKLSNDPRWLELLNIKYRASSSGKVQIKPKNDMIKEGIPSPDFADGLSLTFYEPDRIGTRLTEQERFFYKKMQQNKQKNLKSNTHFHLKTR